MSSFSLRLLALLTMLVDHTGLALFPEIGLLRCVGRVSFPLYCFLLVQGYLHTRDLRAYARRLLLVALLSEIPFDLLIFGRVSSGMEQNVLFALLLGLLVLFALEHYQKEPVKAACAMLAVFVTSMLARVSYGWLGVALCLGFYSARRSRSRQALTLLSVEAVYCLSLLLSGVDAGWVLISLCAMLAAVPVCFYSGRQGVKNRLVSALFYTAYPLHILLLLLLRAMRVVPPNLFG